MTTGQALYRRARRIIPGGTQLLSKRPELFLPEQWPAYFSRAKGAETWDLDNRRFLDVSHFGVGTCVLGFADDEVDDAVVRAIRSGSMCTLNCPEEVELAELLLATHKWAGQVRFTRCGGEAMAVAVRLARAATGKDAVAFCGYHGWHDWYLAANLGTEDALGAHLLPGLSPVGVPRSLAGTALPFRYGDVAALHTIIERNSDDLAAIVLEPARDEVDEAFLAEVRHVASRVGAVLIFDEVTSGWRMNGGGIHLLHPTMPDLVVYAKAMGNGYPIAAVVGVESVMDAAESSFISSTFWTERVGPVAALATIRKYDREQVGQTLARIGRAVQDGWTRAASNQGLPLHVGGIPPLSHFDVLHADAAALTTLYIQEMLDKGFLAGPSFYASLAHTAEIVGLFIAAAHDAFGTLATSISEGSTHERLRGPVKHGGFQRLNLAHLSPQS